MVVNCDEKTLLVWHTMSFLPAENRFMSKLDVNNLSDDVSLLVDDKNNEIISPDQEIQRNSHFLGVI